MRLPFGPEILIEQTQTEIFAAPTNSTQPQLKMLFYATGKRPVLARLILPAEMLPAAPPFSGILDTRLPLVPTLPEESSAAVVKLTSILGPPGITYYEYRRHRAIPYQPQGILLPKTCPPGGFRFAATFEFEDLSHASSSATVPCPRSNLAR